MEIVSGKARGINLYSPEGEDVRPTSVRARKALFDSLGDLSGKCFADLFAGSGAVGLEAASRGAETVIFVDASKSSIKIIEKNRAKVERAGVDSDLQIFCGELPAFAKRLSASAAAPDIIFADPPYDLSAELLNTLTANSDFSRWAANAYMIWELPEKRLDLRPPAAPWRLKTIKQLGPARFMLLEQRFF